MRKLPIIAIVLLALTNVGTIFYAAMQAQSGQSGIVYEWLNPQLKFSGKPVVNKASWDVFRNDLIETIEQLEDGGRLKEVAVFFRDLDNGPTFSINANDKFIPASLLKLPLLLTYFRLAELDPELLARELYTEEFPPFLNQQIIPSATLEPGKLYSIDDLLYRLIVYSDNRALQLLTYYLPEISPDEDLYLETYKDLGIIDAKQGDVIEGENITVKSYASLFRILFNASYLSKEFSDKSLEYLSKSEFNDGLRKGVSEEIPIAHKFGERYASGVFQLHDCGIVYYPENPYLLCVMTKGSDFDALSDAIGAVSKAVYKEFDSRKLP